MPDAVVVIPAAVLFGFGALGWNALVYVSAGERAAPELAARSVAVAATVVFLISAFSTPLLGALASHAGWDVFWIVTAVLAAAGALVAASLRRDEASTSHPEHRSGTRHRSCLLGTDVNQSDDGIVPQPVCRAVTPRHELAIGSTGLARAESP